MPTPWGETSTARMHSLRTRHIAPSAQAHPHLLRQQHQPNVLVAGLAMCMHQQAPVLDVSRAQVGPLPLSTAWVLLQVLRTGANVWEGMGSMNVWEGMGSME